jgi:ABC-2 type transport system ATP-binding protein
MDLAIEAEGLAKTYGAAARKPAAGAEAEASPASNGVEAVRGVDLRIEQGEIYALLGPNGAGKTTTLSMLTTLLLPSRGRARVAGFDVVQQPSEVRRRIGVTFQEVVLDQELSGRQVLDFHGSLYGMSRRQRQERIRELAALVELEDALDRKAARYSGGMKRRLELARGLMTEPAVLFLDEPTQGLDPQNRASIWRYIRELRERTGMTLLLTTHYMEEAETLADRVGIIDGGLLAVEGAPAALVRDMGADVVDMVGEGDAAALEQRLRELTFVQHTRSRPAEGGFVRIQVGVDVGERRLSPLIGAAADAGFHVHEVSVARPSLAEVFLAWTGHELRDRVEP